MKIAIIGSHGIGKTTVAKEIAKRMNLPYIHEVAREVNNMGYEISYPSNPNTQLMIFLRQLRNEMYIWKGVFDRSLIDNIAYSIASNSFSYDILREMEMIAVKSVEDFNAIFMLHRFSNNIKKDKCRSDDFEYHIRIECIIEDLLSNNDIKYYDVHNENHEDRISKIMNILNELNHWYIY